MRKKKIETNCRVPTIDRRRIYLRIFLNFFVTVGALVLLLAVFPQLGRLKDFYKTIWLILILVGLQIFIWPVLMHGFLSLFKRIAAIVLLIVFPLIYLVLPALLLMTANWVSPGLKINSFGSALIIAFFMVLVSLVFSIFFAADDESAIFRWILKRSNPTSAGEDSGKPGIIFLEIDGLAAKVLSDSMAIGKAPNMKRWLSCGSHKMVTWQSDLSSQTSAAQAGILHGNNFGIPAFRWYDKIKKEVVVSSSIKDVAELEKQISNGKGLLSPGGSARGCLLSGDARRVLMTASRALDVTSADLQSYYLNPSNLLKTCSLMVWDWYLEKRAAWSQKIRNEQPRINRGGIYFLLRSAMTVLLRDFCFFSLKGDMYSGVPFAYATLAGYDEVSHHSGFKRPDSIEILRKLDREFGKLEKIAADAPRKYRLVVLSDHGHTQGATFSDRYQEKLEDVVSRLINTEHKDFRVSAYKTYHESAYYLEAAFQDYRFSKSKAGKLLRSTLIRNQQIKVGKNEQDQAIVLASGNLGLVYFPGIANRASLERLTQEFPDLLAGLIAHPGIGFLIVRSEARGSVALGKKGKIYLASGIEEGENPLEGYGPTILSNLVRTDNFPNFPDILVMSTYWKDSDEVAAFEELVSSHGGAGGEQSRPFILYPAEFDLGPEKLEGAETLYRVFKRWTTQVLES